LWNTPISLKNETKKGKNIMKNYIVKMKSSSNIVNLANYLMDENHNNHKTTSKIIELTNTKDNFIKANLEEEAELEIKKQIARKGGRPTKEKAISFTLNFPKKYNPSEEQVAKINNSVLEDLAKYLNIELSELTRKSYAVQHVQDNEHYHLLVSTILNGKKNRIIRSRSALTFIKKSFTLHTDKILNTNIEEYTPDTNNSYDKKEILIAEKQTMTALKQMIKYEKSQKNEKTVKFLQGALIDLEKGQTNKATKKIKKYQGSIKV
jgi:hypothetical protein